MTGTPAQVPRGLELTRRRSAELFVVLRDAPQRRRPADRPRRAGAPAPAARRALRAPLPQPRRAVRGPRAGRHDRPDQVDRPLRHRPRRRVLDVRHADDHRRDQALLPGQGLGDPGAPAAPGAADADRLGDRRAHPVARSLPHTARARRDDRLHAWRRSSRASSRATPTPRCRWTPPTTATRGPRRCSTRSGSTTPASSTSRSASRSSRCWTSSTPREKRILLLRFFKNMTQSQIAAEIGVSQMHVSRLLTRTLGLAADLAGGRDLDRSRGSSPPARRGWRGGTRPTSDDEGHPGQRERHDARARRRGSSRRRPSWISWARTTGPRAQERRPPQRPRAGEQAAAVRQEEDRRGHAHRHPARR